MGILAFVGATLLLAFAPFLAPLLVVAFIVYLLARRGVSPAASARDPSTHDSRTDNLS